MSYRVTPEGDIICETVSDALALQDAVLVRKIPAPEPRRRGRPPSKTSSTNGSTMRQSTVSASTLDRLFGSLSENTQRVVSALADNPDGLETNELAQAIHLPTTALPPLMRSLRTLAERCGLSEDGVVSREEIVVQGRPRSRYRLDSALIEEAKRRR
jgi:hypothetical protein